MKQKNLISVDELAKMINVHKVTIETWLCHYTLGKYTEDNTKSFYQWNSLSIDALRRYLKIKGRNYLASFDKKYAQMKRKKICNQNL